MSAFAARLGSHATRADGTRLRQDERDDPEGPRRPTGSAPSAPTPTIKNLPRTV